VASPIFNSIRPHQSLDEMIPDAVYFNNARAEKRAAGAIVVIPRLAHRFQLPTFKRSSVQ
jgi:hypothetical protein